jgi:hypothetical protein
MDSGSSAGMTEKEGTEYVFSIPLLSSHLSSRRSEATERSCGMHNYNTHEAVSKVTLSIFGHPELVSGSL